MLCGLLTPTAGSATVGGFDIATQPEAVKQQHRLHVAAVLALRRPHGRGEHRLLQRHLRRARARRRAERKAYVLRDGRASRNARLQPDRLLSGGWKQRLALGCAILHEPPILFLDEPTSGVDPIAAARFWDLIYELSEAGLTVFVTTHYMDEAEYCDRLALMYRGRIDRARHAPDELKRSLTSHHLMDLDSTDSRESMNALEAVDGILDVAVFGGGLHITVDDPLAAAPRIRQALSARGIAIGSSNRSSLPWRTFSSP